MNRILSLVKKDARHLWPSLVLVWALMQLACYFDFGWGSSLPVGIRSLAEIIADLAPAVCGAFVVIVIQQERLIGDRQYWLTRPFSARDLLGSKVLFILLTLNLPLLVFQSIGMAVHGLSPFEHLSELLWRQLFFTAFLVIAPAALAVITRSPGYALTTALVIGLALAFAPLVYSLLPGGAAALLVGWAMFATSAAIALFFGAAIVALQDWRRRPAIPRGLFAAGLAVWSAAVIWLPSPDQPIRRRLSTRPIGPQEFQITLDRRQPKSRSIWSNESYNGRDPNHVYLEIPIRVGTLGNEDQLIVNRLQLTPKLGPVSPIGWVADAMIHGVVDGAGWLRFFVDPSSYGRLANQSIDLQGTVDLTLFVHTQTVDFRHGTTEVPGVGVCSPYPIGCYTALPRASIEIDHNGRLVTYIIAPEATYDPFPTSLSLIPVRHIPTAPGDLVVRKPVAWFTRSFEFRDIRLGDFVR